MCSGGQKRFMDALIGTEIACDPAMSPAGAAREQIRPSDREIWWPDANGNGRPLGRPWSGPQCATSYLAMVVGFSRPQLPMALFGVPLEAAELRSSRSSLDARC